MLKTGSRPFACANKPAARPRFGVYLGLACTVGLGDPLIASQALANGAAPVPCSPILHRTDLRIRALAPPRSNHHQAFSASSDDPCKRRGLTAFKCFAASTVPLVQPVAALVHTGMRAAWHHSSKQ